MTYQSRLLLYVGMLIVLLVGMMTLSFKAARDVIVMGASDHLRHAALRKEAAVATQVQELNGYTEVIASDIRLQEYLYIILELGASAEVLGTYFDRQFSTLRSNFRLIITPDGRILLGEAFPGLVEKMQEHLKKNANTSFFFPSADGVVMVAVRPVIYQKERLAYAVVARVMDQAWLTGQEQQSSDYLFFFEQDGRISQSSNIGYEGLRVDPAEKQLIHGEEQFRLREVRYGERDAGVPRLWFGVSETRLFEMLGKYQRWVFTFAALGSLAVLLVGWLMLRNFRRPMTRLMVTTEEMINGNLPVMTRSEANTEMDHLVNRFADVLDALRREQSKLERANRRLQETAITDSLTGLYNRRYLQEITPALFAQTVRDGRYLTAILLDLDYFKAINDQYGHLGGDAVLVHFARLLKHNSRANDYLFRIGGEEFLILNVTEDPGDSVALGDKMRALAESSPGVYQGETIPVTVSGGISCCSGKAGETSLSSLMRAADKALYEAKSAGRNQIVVHSSCREAATAAKPRNNISLIRGIATTKSDA
jgi:diguanylate cyclase (GGDEF)-like protein